jgi:hypothetical protein
LRESYGEEFARVGDAELALVEPGEVEDEDLKGLVVLGCVGRGVPSSLALRALSPFWKSEMNWLYFCLSKRRR